MSGWNSCKLGIGYQFIREDWSFFIAPCWWRTWRVAESQSSSQITAVLGDDLVGVVGNRLKESGAMVCLVQNFQAGVEWGEQFQNRSGSRDAETVFSNELNCSLKFLRAYRWEALLRLAGRHIFDVWTRHGLGAFHPVRAKFAVPIKDEHGFHIVWV